MQAPDKAPRRGRAAKEDTSDTPRLKKDVDDSPHPDGDALVTLTLKDLEKFIDSAVQKSMSGFRDEFLKLLDERLSQFSARIQAVEVTCQELDKRLTDLEKSLDAVTESGFALETRVDTVTKMTDGFSDASLAHIQDQIRENMVLTNDVEQYSRRLNIRIYGITPKENESFDETVLSDIRNNLNLDCDPSEIESAHPLPSRNLIKYYGCLTPS